MKEAASEPPGRINEFNGFSSSLYLSIFSSIFFI
jgi:hypothetical protein